MTDGAPVNLPECVCASLRQVTRAVTQAYDEALRPSGLRSMQFQLLLTIQEMGEATITELRTVVGMDQTTATRSVALLEKQGWVERRPRPDRRVKAYALSSGGKRVLALAIPLWRDIHARVVRRLGDQALGELRGSLVALLNLPSSP